MLVRVNPKDKDSVNQKRLTLANPRPPRTCDCQGLAGVLLDIDKKGGAIRREAATGDFAVHVHVGDRIHFSFSRNADNGTASTVVFADNDISPRGDC